MRAGKVGADTIGEMGGDQAVGRLALGSHGAPLRIGDRSWRRSHRRGDFVLGQSIGAEI